MRDLGERLFFVNMAAVRQRYVAYTSTHQLESWPIRVDGCMTWMWSKHLPRAV